MGFCIKQVEIITIKVGKKVMVSLIGLKQEADYLLKKKIIFGNKLVLGSHSEI